MAGVQHRPPAGAKHRRFWEEGRSGLCGRCIRHAPDVRAFVDTVKTQTAATKSSAAPLSEQPTDPVDQLERLGKLHAAGVLTAEELSAKKAEILARL